MKNQKGFAPILLAVAAVVVIGVLSIGYFVINKNSRAGAGGIVPKLQLPGTAGLNSNCELKDPELCRYINGTAKTMDADVAKGFSGRSTTTDKSGIKSETIWEMQDDKTHFQSLQNGREMYNMITIGATTYTKDLTDGKWFKATAKTAGASSDGGKFVDVNSIKNGFADTVKEIKDQTTYKALGKAACGSLTCFKYQIINAQLPDSKQYLYFDDREYRMRMMEVTDAFGTTVTAFSYGSVSITAPAPVKEGGVGMIDPSLLQQFPTGEPSSVDASKLEENAQEIMKKIQEAQGSSSAGE